MNVVALVQPTEPFRILFFNFGKHPPMITEDQVVGHAEPQPTSITQLYYSLADTIGLVHEKKP